MKTEWKEIVTRHFDLEGFTLDEVKADLWDVLDHAQAEVPALLEALNRGGIDGHYYVEGPSGTCCCLVGTIAKVRGIHYSELPGIDPSIDNPAEILFMEIRPGDTPENHAFACQAWEWIMEYQLRLTSPE